MIYLLDVAPDPPQTVIGIGVLIVLVLVVLAITGLLIGGLVLLLVWRKRRKAGAVVTQPVRSG